MKAVHCVKYGSHKDLVVVDVERPGKPQTGQVKVDVKTTGIQFSDLVRIAGEYQDSTEPPFTVGGDAGGLIAEVGEGVEGFEVGDRVITPAGCVEEINISARAVTKLPAGTDLELAASFRNNYATGLWGLQYGRLQPGETLLVHGAAGGVGLAAVDLGKLFGATVIATASSDDKLEVVKTQGADHTINYTDGFRDAVKDLTGGRGADVIYDPVGGDVFDESMRCIAPFGRILIVGFTSGRAALAKTNHLLVKDAQVIGYTMGGLKKHNPEKDKANAQVLMNWLAHGRIAPHVSHRLPMEDIVDAYQLLVDRKVIGKVMVTN
jgi:NADPH2:quinone reductase